MHASAECSAIADKLEEFLRRSFQIADDDPGFTRTVDLFETGYVDSVGVIELITFINDAFELEVPDEVVLSEDFASVDGMAGIIASARARARAG